MDSGNVERALGRIEGKLEAILDRLNKTDEALDKSDTRCIATHATSDQRLADVEKCCERIMVYAGLAGGGVAIAATLLPGLLKLGG